MANNSLALLCEAILEDHFGYYVKCVGHALLERDLSFRELRIVLKETCKQSDVCRSMAIMELHGLILFTLTNRGVYYSIVPDNVLRLIHLPRAIHAIKGLYGDLCGQIVNELGFYGRATYEKCVSSLWAVHSQNDCQYAFIQLAQNQLIRKCDVVVSNETAFPIMQKDPKPFEFIAPTKTPVEMTNGSRKRKLDENEDADLWCINWPQIERYLHTEQILNLVRNHRDYIPSDEFIWRSFLYIANSHIVLLTQQQSEPITINEICRTLKQVYNQSMEWAKADAILAKFTQSNQYSSVSSTIIRKTGDTAGGSYIINYAAAIEMFCNEHVESVLRERIDERAIRIFRLLRLHTNIEEDFLPKMAMLAPNETKEICYLMLENGCIFSKPIAKTTDFAPARTVYFYSYKLPDLIANVTALCYDSLRNLIRRRLQEVSSHKVLLNTWQKIETIKASINSNEELSKEDKEAQAEETETVYMTDEDKRNYQRHVHNQKRLMMSEIGIAQALFVFQLGRLFNTQTTLMESAKSTKRKRTTVTEW